MILVDKPEYVHLYTIIPIFSGVFLLKNLLNKR